MPDTFAYYQVTYSYTGVNGVNVAANFVLDVDTTTDKAVSLYGTGTYKVGSTTYSITSLAPAGTDGSDNDFTPGTVGYIDGVGFVLVTTDPTADGTFSDGDAQPSDVDVYDADGVNGAFWLEDNPNDTHEAAYTVTKVACYCRGTGLLTPRGRVAVEDLAAGDLLVTRGGAARPVRWVGRRSYAGRFLRANAGVLPIRFAAGSLGAGLPLRDLMVSPDHAMLLDGALIPARALVNGDTIAQLSAVDRVDYFHIELDSHDVVFAEGAASESYVADGTRARFDNAASAPGAEPAGPAEYCAPRYESGAVVERVRRRLAPSRAA